MSKILTWLLRYEEGLSVANQIKANGYLECSAKTKTGVKEVFEVAAKAALQKKVGNKIQQINNFQSNRKSPAGADAT